MEYEGRMNRRDRVVLMTEGKKLRWIERFTADEMQREGRGIYDPGDHGRMQEVPAHERLKASEGGAIRGTSCSYSAGIPGRGTGTPRTDKDGHAVLVDGVPVLERQLDPAQRLAMSPRALGALREHMKREQAVPYC